MTLITPIIPWQGLTYIFFSPGSRQDQNLSLAPAHHAYLQLRIGLILVDQLGQVLDDDADVVQDGPDHDVRLDAVPDVDEGEADEGGEKSNEDAVTTLGNRLVDVPEGKGGSGCSKAVEHTPRESGVMGLNPARCRAFSLLYLIGSA